MEQNKNQEEIIKAYEQEIDKLEVSKLDASSNYRQAEKFIINIVQNEDVEKEDKVQLCKKAFQHLQITKEHGTELNKLFIAEYMKTNQYKKEFIDKLTEDMAEDNDFIYELVPYMDYTKEHGLSYMALKKSKNGNLEKYFVSSKKDIVPYTECETTGIHFKHQKNDSKFSLKSYLAFFKGTDNVSAGGLFSTLVQNLRKYIIFPLNELYDIVALWIMHTYIYCIFRYVPYIWLNSTTAGCGKSTVLDVIYEYAFNSRTNVGSTPAATFRLVEQNGSVLILDEFENMTGEDKALLLTILKVGFKAGSKVTRCSTDNNFEPIEYSAFSPKIFAGITEIDDVLLTRCIKIDMKMAKDKSMLQEFNNNNVDLKQESAKIRNDLHIFGLKYVDKIYNLYNNKDLFSLEKDYTPREKDLWKPLITIAKIVDKEINTSSEESILRYSKILHEELEKVKYSEVKPRLLHFLDEYIKDRNDLIFKDWYPLSELFYDLKESGEFSDIKSNESLGKYLSGFGFEKEIKKIPSTSFSVRDKKKTGYYLTKEKLAEVKKNYGMDMM